jgi:hypothetical protein
VAQGPPRALQPGRPQRDIELFTEPVRRFVAEFPALAGLGRISGPYACPTLWDRRRCSAPRPSTAAHESLQQVMPNEDVDVSEEIAKAYRNLGVTMLVGARIEGLSR